MLDRARPASAAAANESSRFVVPLSEQKIDCVLERAGSSVVVLWRDKNVGIERTNLRSPCFGVRLTVLPIEGGNGSSRSGRLKSLMSTSSDSASLRVFATSQTHFATASPFRFGRVLPRMIAIFIMI